MHIASFQGQKNQAYSQPTKTDAVRRFIADTRGASFIEYIIVVGLVAIIAIAAFRTFGAKVIEKLNAETQGLDQLQPGG